MLTINFITHDIIALLLFSKPLIFYTFLIYSKQLLFVFCPLVAETQLKSDALSWMQPHYMPISFKGFSLRRKPRFKHSPYKQLSNNA